MDEFEVKIQAVDKQIKDLQERKTKLLKEKKEKQEREKRERAYKISEILSSLGIDTVEKANKLKAHLENDPNFKNFIAKINIETVGISNENEGQKHSD